MHIERHLTLEDTVTPEGAKPINVAAIPIPQGTLLIVRETKKGKDTFYDPSRLAVWVNGNEPPRRVHDLELPDNLGVANWEDPRAYTEGENVVLALTAVCQEGIFPAFLEATVQGEQLKISRGPFVLKDLPGKNLTPIGRNESGEFQFLFRRNGETHKLVLLVRDGETLRETKEIDFNPFKVWWMERRMGTTSAPIILPNGDRLLKIHGSYNENGEEIYTIGVARTDSGFNILQVSKKPLHERHHLYPVLPPHRELQRGMRVVYLCGSTGNEEITDYLNGGDEATIPVSYRREELEALVPAAKNS